MRVLLLFTSSELGGAERSLTRMALASSNINFKLATLGSDGAWCHWLREKGVTPLIFGSQSESACRKFAGAIFKVSRCICSNQFDIVYVCGARAAFVIRFLCVLLPDVKLVHGMRWNPASQSRLDRYFCLMERWAGFMVDGWITNSKASADTLVSRCRISRNKIGVIHNGLSRLPEIKPIKFKRPEILTVANINPRKGYLEYLPVIQLVQKSHPDVHYRFAGRDDMNGELQRAISAFGLDSVVFHLGFQKSLSDWYRRARIFVLPSIWGEGCPTSILEAFSYGLPVVAYAIDGIPELLEHGKNGLLVQPGDSEGLCEAICYLLEHEDEAVGMGEAARKKVAEKFMVDNCAAKHEAFFSRCIELDSQACQLKKKG